MERRNFLALLAAAPSAAALLAACGDDATDNTGPAPTNGPGTTVPNDLDGVQSLRSDATRITGADPSTAAAAVNAFANDLHAVLVADAPTANLVFSPASIALALAMTSAGAKGDTLKEMHSVLHLTEGDASHRAMNGLSALLESLNQTQDNTAEGGSGVSEVQLNIANSLWGQTGLAFEPAFLDLLAAEYGAGLETVDYKADPEGARKLINAWVSDQTKERIPQLLAQGTITPDSRLTLVNAIYLKANWMNAFLEGATADEPFTTATGETVKVPMMRRTDDYAYAEGDGWRAVEVPYVFGSLSLTAMVGTGTDDDSLLTTGDEVFEALSSRKVSLGMPRFDIETSTSLAQVLGALGMATAFTDAADFSGMTTDERLSIGDVIHQANITTDEKGTEAAAATAVIMGGTAAPVETDPVEFTIDRPFTFWLRERTTNAIVFMGRVTDPTQ